MNIRTALEALVDGNSLSKKDMSSVMSQIMNGEVTDAQIGAFLVALRIKGETVDEISAAAAVMRDLVEPVAYKYQNLVDVVGTGGDSANLFNVSTGASFIAAAAGAKVAKHGNRSVSSSSGSADLLESLGVTINLTPDQIADGIDTVGLGFMFAPNHHKAMKYAVGPRKELGLRTLFNILGPLTNPASVKRQVIGVFAEHLCETIAKALSDLGSDHAMVVHSNDGLDEISIAADSVVWELRDGFLDHYTVSPLDFDLPIQTLEGLDVKNSRQSAELIKGALAGDVGTIFRKAANILAINAGATIYVAGIMSTFEEGVEEALRVLNNGEAKAILKNYIEFTSKYHPEYNL